MNLLGDDLFTLPDAGHAGAVAVRLILAAVLGGVLGAERESEGKAAGLRTHMLVALGAAMFVVAAIETGTDIGPIVQGVATGIGFIGAGTILKLQDRQEIFGLTTAASIWLTAAIGVAVGMGRLWLPIAGVACAWVTLFVLGRIERRFARNESSDA
jgi:putative Mg2+ transporter-C (MgtC) family protein